MFTYPGARLNRAASVLRTIWIFSVPCCFDEVCPETLASAFGAPVTTYWFPHTIITTTIVTDSSKITLSHTPAKLSHSLHYLVLMATLSGGSRQYPCVLEKLRTASSFNDDSLWINLSGNLWSCILLQLTDLQPGCGMLAFAVLFLKSTTKFHFYGMGWSRQDALCLRCKPMSRVTPQFFSGSWWFRIIWGVTI